jgi:hypothetical protein
VTRRSLLAAPLALSAKEFPSRPITKGPQFHWFGYYDKLQFDPTSRYVLGMQVDFEHRSPRPDDEIRLGFIDLQDNDRWTEIGRTKAWNWQQGCMLQWLPGSKSEVIWNDRRPNNQGFYSVICDIKTGRRRQIDAPVYTLSPNGQWAIGCDFRRLNDTRPGYGYAGVPDPNFANPAPNDSGIWRVDLKTGGTKLLFSLQDALDVPQPPGDWKYSPWNQSKHWFNHLLIAPGGKRFIFLHRWRGPAEKASFATRMFTLDADGRNPYVIDPYGRTSHFVWRDARSIMAWAWHPSLGKERFYLYHDRTRHVEAVGADVMTVNGHNTYLKGAKWILNDTYPDKERLQTVYVYEIATGRRVDLGKFLSPKPYTGEWRCDTHPRSSPNGKLVCIDSPHPHQGWAGGRQMHLLDISQLS